MRKIVLIVAAMAMLVCASCAACSGEIGNDERTATDSDTVANKGGKVLVAYYSHSGNTQTVAGYIHDITGGDIVRIETAEPYPDDYDDHLEQVRREVASDYRPELTTKIDNIGDYDTVFVGYPIWVETAAPPVASFLAATDVSGKTVIPFCTSGTSSAEASYRLVRSLCPNSTVLDGIQIRRGTYDTAQERISQWLQNLGFAQ